MFANGKYILKRGSKLINKNLLSFSHFNFAKILMKLPKLGDSITDATIVKYSKKVGDAINPDDVIAEVETDKVNVEIKAEGSGTITKVFANEKEKLDVGADFIEYDTELKGAAPTKEAKAEEKKPEVKQEEKKPVKETKEVKEPKAEKKQESKPQTEQPKPQLTPHITGSRNQRKEPMNRMRQRIAERLKGSQNTYATLTTFNEVDMSEVMAIRTKYQEEFLKKASSIALSEMPIVNSVIEGTDIIYRDFIDISVAVATPTGLMVPVIRNCENKSLSDFELTLRDLGTAARDGKIKLEDMVGGTFTVSNGGVYGSMLGTPIINPPQSAILGMHNITNRPVCRGDEIVARPMMYLALSYDHKLCDGREGVLFLKKIKDLVEEPRRILLNL